MHTRLLLALTAALLIVRLPSLVQPMGADQALYAYVGERILHGELAYRDAWDQKPPGIHYLYAALRAVSPRDAVVPAADLLAAALVAVLLWKLGARLGGPIAGGVSAAIFLLLSDPSLGRYGGMRVRAQAETFIALAVTAAVAAGFGATHAGALLAAGLLLGAAFALKYNAGLYLVIVLLALALSRRLTLKDALWIAIGAAIVPLALLLVFWQGGALQDLYQATIVYNVRYSGETYASRWDMVAYLFQFPIRHARVDPLWFAGGLGCLVLAVAGLRRRVLWLPVAWVAAACLSVAINGSRDLPQYFVQAAPGLALAAGLAATVALTPLPAIARWIVVLLVAYGAWRVNDFSKPLSYVGHDLAYVTGRIDRRTHVARYGGARETDKYSPLDNMDLGAFVASRTRPDETVFVFGFSPGAYVYGDRRSASRFFWSRPVILDFSRERPGYGVAGLAEDLRRAQPAYIVLQEHDWAPDVQDSAPFFLSQPALGGWLRAEYHEVPAIAGFQAWERNGR